MQSFVIDTDEKPTVLAAMRNNLPDQPSWSTVRKLMRSRLVTVGGVLCIDEARRLSRGEVVQIVDRALAPPPRDEDIKILHVDQQVIVVEKPSGMVSLRRKNEYSWTWEKRNRQPSLDECVPRMIGVHASEKKKQQRAIHKQPRLFPVHRLDRDSSGIMVFARDEESQTKLIHQFAQHSAVRKYLALIPGQFQKQTVRSQLIRDRGDGLRGSTSESNIGEHAITHFKSLRAFENLSELECKLETGRTNQIRIHLAEAGHPICGDVKYRGPFASAPIKDHSRIHRLALHATQLKFNHPVTNDLMDFTTPWPDDMARFIAKL
ncbi:MAG: RluA family pseudouridine synthase [Planctomycetota bacterium]